MTSLDPVTPHKPPVASASSVLTSAVRDMLPLTATVGLVLYALFTISHLLVLPAPTNGIMAMLAFVTAGTFLLARVCVARLRVPDRWIHPFAALLFGLALINSLAHMVLLRDLKQTGNVVFCIIVIGALLLLQSWFVGGLVVSVGSWALALTIMPASPDLLHYGFMVTTAVLLAYGIHRTRTRSVLRLHKLRQRDSERRAELEGLLLTLRENEALLQQAKDRAEAADHAKTAFITTISHDLKTPLTSISGFADVLRIILRPAPDSTEAEAIQSIKRGTTLMQALIADITDLAQIEANQLVLIVNALTPQYLVESALADLRPQIEDNGLTLNLCLANPLPLVQVDQLRLTQVMNNIIGNAIKYTPSGGTITISGEYDLAAARVVIGVRDTGIGIRSNEQLRVFERFFRASSAREQRIPGSGLGLYISRRIVEAHGGTITLESELGQGTCVWLALPVIESQR
ncbi:MAG: HAMP domain-containing histidine kinase [Roseiflexaceae bacterium]|nr:HAMP domain-containing histidine kinase [Roseiflexaceae bacterium]